MQERDELFNFFGDLAYFETLKSQGYNEISFGRGLSWVHSEEDGSSKVEGMYALYHPEGKVVAYMTIRRRDRRTGKVIPAVTTNEVYEKEVFEDLVRKLRIEFDEEREELSDFLDSHKKE